ncbi:transmembrane [Pyrrhoderma noxium]|uniref:Transmembrane n=1 Tax=Pyrrhoderma noxium TaxID=2282107 RepID=A0A286UPD3_9AGAM|nr:transmembrane [Pyrrhoderma noxium]
MSSLSSESSQSGKRSYARVPLSPPSSSNSRIPVTPAVLRSIFASSRTAMEERSISRIAFFRFAGFVLSCIGISLIAWRGRGIKAGAAGILGVV